MSQIDKWVDRCHFGDCREFLPKLPAAFADSCITDPPYGDTSLVWDKRCEGWIEHVSRALKPAASIWVFGSMRFLASIFKDMEAHGFKYAQDVVWEKQNGSGFQNDRFRRVHEHVIQFYCGAWGDVFKDPQHTNDATAKVVRRKTRPTHTGHIDDGHYVSEDGGPPLMRSVMFSPNEHGKAVHPTQKPLAIIASLIQYSVPLDGIVLDPFMGSGTTGIAANLFGRRFVGCELDKACEVMQAQRYCQSDLLRETSMRSL